MDVINILIFSGVCIFVIWGFWMFITKKYIIKLKVNPDTDEIISIGQTGCPWKPLDAKRHMINALENALKSLEEK